MKTLDARNDAREELMAQHEDHMELVERHIRECRAIIEMVDRILNETDHAIASK
jgi:hypothetical protein